ncbi:hypothetical protein B9Z19DRAFT_1119379 [Tuber borchii]|uniref:Transposase Tc1-like domain-containing protein n=1 Tax=Tuber borchii TaxID=42251 RepID=A0A2T7A6M8_TUBBO|nr:hypothetical protein B9Z19DRAFT_1119379 [Tuber borchii]
MSGKETTRDERVQIIALQDKASLTWKEIGRKLNIDFHTCQKIYKYVKINRTPSNKRRSGRPMLFGAEEKTELLAFVTHNKRTRRLQWEEIIAEVGYSYSVRTIRSVMALLKYHKRLPHKKLVQTIS